MERGRHSPPVEEQDRLAALLRDLAEPGEQWRREGVAGLAAKVDEAHGREPAADPLAQLEPLQARPALGTRRRASEDGGRALQHRTLRRHGAGVVAWVRLLLVRGVVLLVDADEAQTAHRSEDRGPRADYDPRIASRDPLALVPPLRFGQAGMEQRDRRPCSSAVAAA